MAADPNTNLSSFNNKSHWQQAANFWQRWKELFVEGKSLGFQLSYFCRFHCKKNRLTLNKAIRPCFHNSFCIGVIDTFLNKVVIGMMSVNINIYGVTDPMKGHRMHCTLQVGKCKGLWFSINLTSPVAYDHLPAVALFTSQSFVLLILWQVFTL